jgi:hypothetical protein
MGQLLATPRPNEGVLPFINRNNLFTLAALDVLLSLLFFFYVFVAILQFPMKLCRAY